MLAMELRTGDRVSVRLFPDRTGTVVAVAGDGLTVSVLWDGTERTELADVIYLRKVL